MRNIHIIGTLAIVVLLVSTTAMSAAVDKDKVAKDLLSKKYNVASDKLEITGSSAIQLPLTGKAADEYKTIDKSTGNVYGIAIDDNGKEVDIQKLLQDEDTLKKPNMEN